MSKASFIKANLVKSVLKGATLICAHFDEAIMDNADLSNSKANEAYFNSTSLEKADFSGAQMKKTHLTNANLIESKLIDSDIDGAVINGAKLDKVVFEPLSVSFSDLRPLRRANYLASLTFKDSPHALIELREDFKKAGLRQQEREITYAIEKRKRERSGWFESILRYLLFEITCEYGLKPTRPLKIIGILIFIFSIFYFIPLNFKTTSALLMVPLEKHTPVEDEITSPKRLQLKFWGAVFYALYFSVLSSFRIGWRYLNIDNWILRLQPKAFNLYAIGWVRTISGLQSLLCLYFVVLWILAYFGNPFE